MDYNKFINIIPKIKNQPLLASQAHIKMAPTPHLNYLNSEANANSTTKNSAVLMLCYPKDNQTYLLLIERAKYNGIHSSQISFPGGKQEDFDFDLKHTALREAEEEVGIIQTKVDIIKAFSKVYVPPSNFMVYPFLGISNTEPNFILQTAEVANLIEIPVENILDDSLVEVVKMDTSYALGVNVPAFVIKENIVWGATAMMLSELKEILRRVLI